MCHYVPILQHPVFYTGLGLFTAGVFSHLLASMFTRDHDATLDGTGALRYGITLAAIVTAVAIAAFIDMAHQSLQETHITSRYGEQAQPANASADSLV